jgi:predicted DNA-binding transcriptional regulator AlpA
MRFVPSANLTTRGEYDAKDGRTAAKDRSGTCSVVDAAYRGSAAQASTPRPAAKAKTGLQIVGWDRSTILKEEGLERFPRRRQPANGQVVYLGSEIVEWIKSLPVAPLPFAAKREIARPILS